MEIVWDEPKRLANLAKHGLDFRDLEAGFAFEDAVTLLTRSSRTGRARYKSIGRLHGRIVTVMLSPLGSEAVAVVSLRVAEPRRGECMRKSKAPLVVPPDTARGYTDEDLAEVSDNPEWTEEDFRNAKPFREVFPELYESWKRSRGPQKAPTKVAVSLRLSRDVIERFKADGPGWQTRMDEALRKAVGL